jgi:hypothetical protein
LIRGHTPTQRREASRQEPEQQTYPVAVTPHCRGNTEISELRTQEGKVISQNKRAVETYLDGFRKRLPLI